MADTGASIHVERIKTSADMATVAGLACGFGLLVTAIFLGGSPESFINVPGFLIVMGGTFGVVTVCFSLTEIARTFRVIMKTVFYSVRDPSDAAVQVLQVAEIARKTGVLSLQPVIDSMNADVFLHKGMSMVVDGQFKEPPLNPDNWPYQNVCEAINDGWRVISFPDLSLLMYEDNPLGLGCEFILVHPTNAYFVSWRPYILHLK